ncbi:MAG: Ig-like domain-containing protein [Verrucomicrobiota bacterium]
MKLLSKIINIVAALLIGSGFGATEVFYDGFDGSSNRSGMSPMGWSISSSTDVFITEGATTPYSSPFSLRLTEKTYSTLAVASKVFPEKVEGQATAWVKVMSTSKAPLTLQIRSTTGIYLLGLRLMNTGKMGYDLQDQSGTVSTGVAWKPGVWQKLKVEWFADSTFNAFINDISVVMGKPLAQSLNPGQITFTVGSNLNTSVCDGFVDEIYITGLAARIADDFDNGNSLGRSPLAWNSRTPIGTSISIDSVTDGRLMSSPYCIKFSDLGGTGYPELFKDFETTETGSLIFSAKVPSKANADFQAQLRTNSGVYLGAVRFDKTGYMSYNIAGASSFIQTKIPWQVNVWQSVRVDWNGDFFNAFLDGVKFADNLLFDGEGNPGRVSFKLGSGAENNQVSYLDNVVVMYPDTGVNKAPVVSITNPTDGAIFPSLSPILINSNPYDQDGIIQKVDLFQNDSLIGTVRTSPYTFNWTPPESGTYTLTAKTVDNNGVYGVSAPVRVQVNVDPNDPFKIKKINPTKWNGHEWFSNWGNKHVRTLKGEKDSDDDWFNNQHGSPARCSIDGAGVLTASGDKVRMYVNDPSENPREWDENQEITVYYQRVSETETLSYSGPQIFTRTNHGAYLNGGRTKEEEAPADTRGYGMKINLDGTFGFEKEIKHNVSYASSYVSPNLWTSFPKNQWVGVKYIIRNMQSGTQVKLQVYLDLTNGLNGGTWQLIHEFVDTGSNLGVRYVPCYPGVDPAMVLTRAKSVVNSESLKPHVAVYFRHEYGTMKYSRASIREINPLP